jgi:hypothetical protein
MIKVKIRGLVVSVFVSCLRQVSIYNYRKTIKRFIRHYHPKINIKLESRKVIYNERLVKLGYSRDEKYWNLLYQNINGIISKNYIPESIYYFEIEPRMNNLMMRLAYSDKNTYDRLKSKSGLYILPETFCHNIRGINYNSLFQRCEIVDLQKELRPGKYIIKPSLDSGGGKNIGVFDYCSDGITFYQNNKRPLFVKGLDDIMAIYNRDFVVQIYLQQHKYFQQLNSSSVNTMRVMTYRSVIDDKIHILHRIMKVGQRDYFTDNEWTGSNTIGVNSEGDLNSFAVNKYGVKTEIVNGIRLTGLSPNPFVKKVDRAAIEIASNIFYSRLLGIDFAINEEGEVVFIEVNHGYNGINFFQYNNGPLFGDFTDEVIEFCLKTKKEHFVLY